MRTRVAWETTPRSMTCGWFKRPPRWTSSFFQRPGVRVGQPSTVRFTVTNTTELAAKQGVQITDNLAAGLVVADNPRLSNTCGGTVSATAGSGTITITGAGLATDQVSCRIEIDVQ